MADFKITIYVEGGVVSTGGASQWLGRAFTVALTHVARQPTPEEAVIIRRLLSPWEWETISWKSGAPDTRFPPDSALRLPLDEYLASIASSPKAWSDDRLTLPNLSGNEGQVDDSDEASPNWPGLLAQLSRLGAAISHDLHLADAAALAGSATSLDLQVQSLTLKGAPGSFSDSRFEIVTTAYLHPPLAPATSGLIDPETRLVLADGEDETATRAWQAELPARLGRAMDPLARLADVFETADPQPDHAELKHRVEVAFLSLLSTDTLGPILQSIAALGSASFPADACDQFASQWAMNFQPKYARVCAELATALVPESHAEAGFDSIRSLRSSATVLTVLQRALIEAMPEAPKGCRAEAQRWLDQIDNVDVVLNTLAPDSLARRRLLQGLVAKAAADASLDFGAVENAFPAGFRAAIGDIVSGITDQIIARCAASVFSFESASVDCAVRDGIPFRVDALFSEADPENHTFLDGYLVAICDRQRDGTWGDWLLASQGKTEVVRLIKQPAPDGEIACTRSGPVAACTPLPVAFHAGLEGKSRIAAENYRGHAIMPWTRPSPEVQSGLPADRAEISIDYTTVDGLELPPLAYGQTYRVMRGYQAPGGLMPAHFCDPDAPFDFVPNEPDPRFVSVIKLLRTQMPGAPRLLNEVDGARVAFSPPDGKGTRPLWREHLALWSPDHAAEAEALRDVPTVFLDPISGYASPTKFEFAARPPALASESSDDATDGVLVRKYWTARDDFWRNSATIGAAESVHHDDPAVVGCCVGEGAGTGGMAVRLHRITRTDGLDPGAWTRVTMKPDIAVKVAVEVKEGTAIQGTVALNEDGTCLTVALPCYERFVLEMATIVDERFFSGDDQRFAEPKADPAEVPRKPEREVLDGTEFRILEARSRVAFECLPQSEAALPLAAALWNGTEIAALASKETVAAFTSVGPDFDIIGELRPVWQSWQWDGGPVRCWDHEDYGLKDGTIEPVGGERHDKYVEFETEMFADRGSVGATAQCNVVAGHPTRLFSLENRPNRGADYLRVRIEAKSRYAALRPFAAGNTAHSAARLPKDARRTSPWRGFPIGARRRDTLPTPRIALAAPLFGSIGDDNATGGIALYLDHAMYDTREGGGLADVLEVQIVYETVDYADHTRAALAIGADPIGPNPDPLGWSPWADQGPKRLDTFKGGKWETGEDVLPEVRLEAGLILGQTLEPNSFEPQFPYSIAFVDPTVTSLTSDKALIRPDALARIKVRRTANGTLPSDWSQALWVQFLPDAGDTEGLVAERDNNGRVSVKLAALASEQAKANMAYLKAIAGDKSPDPGNVHLVGEVRAVVMSSVIDASGKKRTRFGSWAKCAGTASGLTFELNKGEACDAIRLLCVQRVVEPEGALGTGDLANDLFSSSGDATARVVMVGPYLKI